jgi:hypothetical protein
MKNPYLKLLEACGTTQVAFRERFGFSKPVLDHIITGQYVSLSDRMIESLGELCWDKGVDASQILRLLYDSDTLVEAYREWQVYERQQVRDKYDVEPKRWSKDTSPFQAFIEDTAGSRQRFCKDLKLDAASVSRYASGKSVSMPLSIETVFRDLEFGWLRRMLELQSDWRTEHVL